MTQKRTQEETAENANCLGVPQSYVDYVLYDFEERERERESKPEQFTVLSGDDYDTLSDTIDNLKGILYNLHCISSENETDSCICNISSGVYILYRQLLEDIKALEHIKENSRIK